ncbi:MAG TPA: NADH:ubiquinone reductase (Na(+)-transporting) subunit E [Acholeplasmataceae bacterium]|nr:NADH:ubiquinone reductase (Na(+)-transporting) subunit E [Acholeplasmataceae bacterium]
MDRIIEILIATITNHNIALAYILGMCPLIAISTNVKNAKGMGVAVIFVVTLTAIINYPIYMLLKSTGTSYLALLIFIITIAATVQILEIVVDKYFPKLYNAFGIFLPLITVNCIVLAVSLFFVNREYTFTETAAFSFGSSIGWALAIILVAGIREKMAKNQDLPKGLAGRGIVFIILGILSLAFIGFTGLANI